LLLRLEVLEFFDKVKVFSQDLLHQKYNPPQWLLCSLQYFYKQSIDLTKTDPFRLNNFLDDQIL